MAAPFSYTTVPNSLRQFIKGIPNRAVPAKVDGKYLASIGLKAANDKSIITVLKFVNLLDGGGTPTVAYKSYRDKSKGPLVLAEQIRTAYKSRYETYEDAEKQNDDNLRDFFSANTKVGAKAISFMIATFKVLAEFGDFSRALSISPLPQGMQGGSAGTPELRGNSTSPQLHINLQLHLPDSSNPAIYEAIFDAMARKLAKFL